MKFIQNLRELKREEEKPRLLGLGRLQSDVTGANPFRGCSSEPIKYERVFGRMSFFRQLFRSIYLLFAFAWALPSFAGNGSSTILHVYQCPKYKLLVISQDALEDMIFYYKDACARGFMPQIQILWSFSEVLYTPTTVRGDSVMIAKESIHDHEIQFIAEGASIPEDCGALSF